MKRTLPNTSNVRERIIDTKDDRGTFHIYKQQDCEKMMDAIRDLPSYLREQRKTQEGVKYLGSVPNLLAVAWAKEWGVRLYGREWLQLTKRRLKHDPNWNRLRVQR